MVAAVEEKIESSNSIPSSEKTNVKLRICNAISMTNGKKN